MVLAKAQHGPRIIENFSASAREFCKEMIEMWSKADEITPQQWCDDAMRPRVHVWTGDPVEPLYLGLDRPFFMMFCRRLQITEPTLSYQNMFRKQWRDTVIVTAEDE